MRVRLRVREVAQAKGVSQYKLSKASGIDMRTVQRIFRDPYRNVTVETLGKFASVLDVDVSELLESVPDEK